MQRADERNTIAGALTRVADGVQRLVAEHLKLARLEIGQDLAGYAKDSSWVVVSLPLLFVGHALVCAGVAVFVAQTFGLGWALVGLGALNLSGGAFLLREGVQRLSVRRPALATTVTQDEARSPGDHAPGGERWSSSGREADGKADRDGAGPA